MGGKTGSSEFGYALTARFVTLVPQIVPQISLRKKNTGTFEGLSPSACQEQNIELSKS